VKHIERASGDIRPGRMPGAFVYSEGKYLLLNIAVVVYIEM
jgi:hypothetical protein